LLSAGSRRLQNVTIKVMDAQALDMPDASVDTIDMQPRVDAVF
jgi:hypothetical protein